MRSTEREPTVISPGVDVHVACSENEIILIPPGKGALPSPEEEGCLTGKCSSWMRAVCHTLDSPSQVGSGKGLDFF